MRNKTLLAAAAARLIFRPPCASHRARKIARPPLRSLKIVARPPRATPPLPPVWLAQGGCDISTAGQRSARGLRSRATPTEAIKPGQSRGPPSLRRA